MATKNVRKVYSKSSDEVIKVDMAERDGLGRIISDTYATKSEASGGGSVYRHNIKVSIAQSNNTTIYLFAAVYSSSPTPLTTWSAVRAAIWGAKGSGYTTPYTYTPILIWNPIGNTINRILAIGSNVYGSSDSSEEIQFGYAANTGAAIYHWGNQTLSFGTGYYNISGSKTISDTVAEV